MAEDNKPQDEIIEEDIEEIAEEALTDAEDDNDLMEARKHFKGVGDVAGEWVFDDLTDPITANSLEEALAKWSELKEESL